MKNKTVKKVLFLSISEIFCYSITLLLFKPYTTIYLEGNFIIQLIHFILFLSISIYIFIKKDNKTCLVYSTVFLIISSLIIHFSISNLKNSNGIINFIKYSSKIYFLTIPLNSFFIFYLKNVEFKNFIKVILSKIIILFIISLLTTHFFDNKGTLYSLPFTEFIFFIFSITHIVKNNKQLYI